MTSKPLILLEFNELCPSLLDRFISRGLLPNFARLRRESQTFITDAGEDPPNLNPWIQWVTLHSGQSFARHGIFHLGDAAMHKVPMLWDAVSRAGHSSWVCGSMNTAVADGFKGWHLPDPWAAGVRAKPEQLEDYMGLVRSYVFDYTSERRPATVAAITRFLRFMLAHGLRLKTICKIALHLAHERVADVKWRRASVLDWLQFDLFRSVYRRERPHFSTLFYNSTAHYQHAYWRNMEPELFALKPSEKEQRYRSKAVLYGYQQMDKMIGEIFKLAGTDTAVVLATALSQQPFLAYEDSGGKTFYKARDFDALLRFVGIPPSSCAVEPVMSEQFHLRLPDESSAMSAKRLLDEVRLNGSLPVFSARLEGRAVFAGCSIFDTISSTAILTSGQRSTSFGDVFYQVEGLKSGMHHRDGVLWIRTPGVEGSTNEGKLPLTAVAPMLLEIMGIERGALQLESPDGDFNSALVAAM